MSQKPFQKPSNKSFAPRLAEENSVQIKEVPEESVFRENAFEVTGNTHSPKTKSVPPPLESVQLGPDYEVLEMIGQGGMGYVYKVKDKRKNQVVAVKVVRPELAADKRALKRFEQEAEAAMGLIHPNLVPVYAQGITAGGAPYLVMEYQEGVSLDRILSSEKSLDIDRVIDICVQICQALEHAHAKGIVHRDLKPSNIVLSWRHKDDGSKGDLVRIVDFGIAKILTGAESRETFNMTNTGDLFGSPSYMSPEQCMGYKLDARSDIYALGCVMYEMLSGKPPFISDNPVQTIVKHLNDQPAPLHTTAMGAVVPTGLEKVVMRCLEKDPDNRNESMQQVREDLNDVQIGVTPGERRSSQRHKDFKRKELTRRDPFSRPTPAYQQIITVAALNLICIAFASWTYSDAIKKFEAASETVLYGANIAVAFDDARLAIENYKTSKQVAFMNQYDKKIGDLKSFSEHYPFLAAKHLSMGASGQLAMSLNDAESALKDQHDAIYQLLHYLIVHGTERDKGLVEAESEYSKSIGDAETRLTESTRRLHMNLDQSTINASRYLESKPMQVWGWELVLLMLFLLGANIRLAINLAKDSRYH